MTNLQQADYFVQPRAEVTAKHSARVADASRERRARRGAELERARVRLQDPAYRALHVAVAALFARELKVSAPRTSVGPSQHYCRQSAQASLLSSLCSQGESQLW